jgi:hypothetical protein
MPRTWPSFWRPAYGLPGYFTSTRAYVRDTREHEEEVGEPVEIDDDELGNLHVVLEVHDPALGAPAHGPGNVKRRTFAAAPGNDEGLERLKLLFAVIDGALELFYAAVVDARLREVIVHFLEVGCREQRADAEQIALHWNEDFVDARHRLDGASHAKDGVELVDIAVGFDAGVILLNPPASEETGISGVAGLRVDLHRDKSNISIRFNPLQSTLSW